MNGWDLAWGATCLVVICLSAWENGRRRRVVREMVDRFMESELKRLGLQAGVDRAWDAAHEFGDEPQQALNVMCAHLEHMVTPLPPDLERALRDPSIVVERDHEVRLSDGRTLAEHMAEWQQREDKTLPTTHMQFPEQRVRPCGEGPCVFNPAPGETCAWCGWERPA